MRKLTIAIAFLMSLCLCQAQEYDSLQETFRHLHLQCEDAYMRNDFTLMKSTLDAREALIAEGLPEYMKEEDTVEMLGMYHKDWGSYYSCIADIDGTGYGKALESYRKSLDIFSASSLKSAVLRTEIAQLHYGQKEYEAALGYLEENFTFYSSILIEPSVTALSQVALCQAQLGRFNEGIGNIEKCIALCSDSGIAIRGREELLGELKRKHAKILSLKSEKNGRDSEMAAGLYKEYFQDKRDSILVSFGSMSAEQRERYWLRMHPFITDCYRLEDSAPEFLYDVTLFSKALLLQLESKEPGQIAPTYNQIQDKLAEKECAIEFVRYEKYHQMQLGAIVLHKKGIPEFVRIGSEKDLLDLTVFGGVTVKDALKNRQMRFTDSLYTCKDFHRFIWNKELRSSISNAEKIYFAAEGILHKIAIEYIYPAKKAPIFCRLTSTRELLRDPRQSRTDSMLLCGGIDYNETESVPEGEGNDDIAYKLLKRKGLRFSFLPGSKEEVEAVYELRESSGDTLITGTAVTEQACREAFCQYPVVMVATHGYFGGESERFGSDLRTKTSDMSMSESVLILSGAQLNMRDEAFDSSRQDGILSAKEISVMDLDNVDLFIVSACQSALGHINPDGVYGIQRGLKNAGVQAMIVSLWEVDDMATRHFMINLNKALSEGADVRSAFDRARASLDEEVEHQVRKYDRGRDAGQYETQLIRLFSKPRHKNAFILIDNIQ